MAAAINLGLLLIVLIRGIRGEEDFSEITVKGHVYAFHAPREANFCVISRSVGEENLVLWNTSDPSPENPALPEDLKKRLEVRNNSSYEIHNLTHSDSGLYREECRTDGNVTRQRNTSITVCSTQEIRGLLFIKGTIDIPCRTEGGPVGDDLTVQWFRENGSVWTRIFMHDNLSLNPLMKHLEGRVQLVENGSSLRIYNFTRKDYANYTCLVMEKQQCVSSNHKIAFLQSKYIVHSVGEEAVLPCFDTGLYGPPEFWWGRYGEKRFFAPPSQHHSEGFGNLTDPEQEYRYSDDPVVNDNYSLVFSSLMLNHTDFYKCVNGEYILSYSLMVCPEYDPLTQFFSDGEEVTLSCNSSETTFGRLLWVRKTEQGKSVILYPAHLRGVNELYEGLKDRLNVSSRGKTIVLSNLSPEDGGEYRCVYPVGRVCKSAARTVLIYKHPFGVDSTFYAVWASLMTCGLLGMVCAVVTVNVILKTRRGEQVPVI